MVKKLFRNALLVQIVGAVVAVAGMVVDGAVTGSFLGTDAMAAYGFATPVATVFAACASVCELGASMLVGRLVGAGKTKEASKALSSCLAFAAAFSLLLTAVTFIFSRQIAGLLGADGEIALMAADYLRGFSLCAPALLILTVLMPVMQIDGERRLLIISIVVMTAVNIAGDLLVGLVFKGGLLGMSLATTFSYFVALFVMLIHFFKKKGSLKISFADLRPAYAGEMLSGGLPNALQQVCRSLLILLLNNLLLRFDNSDAVAAFTAIMSAANLCMVVGSGIGSSTSMLTGVFVGEKDDVSIRKLVRTALTHAAVIDAALCALLFACAGLIMPIFLSEAEIIPMAVLGFRLYCLSMLGYSINVTMRLYYQAMKLEALSYIYVVCNSFLFTAAGALILGSLLGVNGVWLSFLFGETLSLAALAAYVLMRTDRPGSLPDRFMFIPKDLTDDVLHRFDGSASTTVEVTGLSEQVRQFSKSSGADERTAYLLALAVEELGIYILANNSPEGGRETVEVGVLCRKDGWTMRMRDSGRRFNPLDILKQEHPDEYSYVGIKLLKDMVVNIEYLDTLNINNLFLEIQKKGEAY